MRPADYQPSQTVRDRAKGIDADIRTAQVGDYVTFRMNQPDGTTIHGCGTITHLLHDRDQVTVVGALDATPPPQTVATYTVPMRNVTAVLERSYGVAYLARLLST